MPHAGLTASEERTGSGAHPWLEHWDAARLAIAAVFLADGLAPGVGYANLVPILFGVDGRRPGSAGIAAVSTLGHPCFVFGPPCIGEFFTLSASLRLALSSVAALAAAISLGAGTLEWSR